MFGRIVAVSKRWSGLITVIGALVIFSGTFVSSQGKDHFNAVKNTIDIARKYSEIQQEFFAIRRDSRKLEDRVKTLEHKRDKFDSENQRLLAELEPSLEHCDKIFWTVSDEDLFSAIQGRLVLSHPGQSTVKKEIEDSFNEIRKMNFGMHAPRQRAIDLVYVQNQVITDEHLAEAKKAVKTFCGECGKANVRTQELSAKLTVASNTLQKELQAEMDNAKSLLSLYSSRAFLLYLLGSAIALYGQFFDKGFPKSDPQLKIE